MEADGKFLQEDHVICPNCVHDFHAVPQSAKDEISSLTETLQAAHDAFQRERLRADALDFENSRLAVDLQVAQTDLALVVEALKERRAARSRFLKLFRRNRSQ